MKRKTNSFLEWLKMIGSIHYSTAEALDVGTCKTYSDASINKTLKYMDNINR